MGLGEISLGGMCEGVDQGVSFGIPHMGEDGGRTYPRTELRVWMDSEPALGSGMSLASIPPPGPSLLFSRESPLSSFYFCLPWRPRQRCLQGYRRA